MPHELAPRDEAANAPIPALAMLCGILNIANPDSPMNPILAKIEAAANASLGPEMVTVDLHEDTPRLADVLDDIDALICRFVQLPNPSLGMLIATWIAQTYAFEHFRYCGYLALRSATPRCGKSLVMRLLSNLTKGSPPITATPTPAVLFRSTRPVLLLDEVDKLRNADKEKYGEVLAVLNCGFEAGGVVDRCNPKTLNVETFPIYGPKALAGIESLADTLADRAFQIQMERSPQRMPRFNLRKLGDTFINLRLALQSWAEDHERDMVETYDALPDEVGCLEGYDDRLQDICEPLIVLATLADVERPEGPAILSRLLDAFTVAAKRREPSGRETQLLVFLDDVAVKKLGEADEVFVRSADLLADCAALEDLASIETGRKLAWLLKHFDLHPGFNASKTERGYRITKSWVEFWRSRYPKKEAVSPPDTCST